MIKRIFSMLLVVMMLVGMVPTSVFAAEVTPEELISETVEATQAAAPEALETEPEEEPADASCVKVLEAAPATATIKQGEIYELALNTVFSDAEGHELTYSFESTVSNQHTKITSGTFYFSVGDVGTYTVTLKAKCASGEVSHTLTITVEKASDGIAAQYGYDETAANSVKVYVTISNDGCPIQAADGTILSNLEVTVPYFDLELYDLTDYYRYGTTGGKGAYTNETVVERPTGLHLYIYLLERYYMGLSEDKCCKGTSGVTKYLTETDVKYLDSTNAYTSGSKAALTLSGSATSLYMSNFWGHDENLMYFRNHCYPLMSAGWGSTSDYILLSDGDTWDVAMFSDWNFHTKGGFFARFDKDSYTVKAEGSLTVSTQKWGTTASSVDFVELTAKDGLGVALYDSEWNLIENLAYDKEDGSTMTFTAPKEAGTYYLMATDPNQKTDTAKVAPATARVVVLDKDQRCETCVDEDGDRYCDVCGSLINKKPVRISTVAEIKEDTTITGYSYAVTELQNNRVFKDEDGDKLDYYSYYYERSTDGGETWSEKRNFPPALFGFATIQFTEHTAGDYMYRFYAYDGYEYSDDTWTLILHVKESAIYNTTFQVGQDYNYNANGKVLPIITIYKTAGFDENLLDYVASFEKGGETVYVYNPADYAISQKDDGSWVVTVDETEYPLKDYEPVTFTDSLFGAEPEEGQTATASGEVVGNYRKYYITTLNGSYSYRSYGYNKETEAFDVYLGGMSLNLPTDTNVDGSEGGGEVLTLRCMSIGTSATMGGVSMPMAAYHAEVYADNLYRYAHSGDGYMVNAAKSRYPFMLYAGSNACTYTYYTYYNPEYALPEGYMGYTIGSSVYQIMTVGNTAQSKDLAMSPTAVMEYTVPSDTELSIYYHKAYYNVTPMELAEGYPKKNEDGTLVYGVVLNPEANSSEQMNYSWRLTDKTGKYVPVTGYKYPASDLTTIYETSGYTDKDYLDFDLLDNSGQSSDEGDINLNVSTSGFKTLEADETFRVRSYRIWQLVSDITGNYRVQPRFNYQILSGKTNTFEPVSGGNGENNWLDVDPDGTVIVAATYDATCVSGSGTYRGLFPATALNRTGVFILSDETAGVATASIPRNGLNDDTTRTQDWDYNYDTWHYNATNKAPTLHFTVSDATKVECAIVTTDSKHSSTLSGWTELTATEGTYYVDLLQFRTLGTRGGNVIIRMTDENGNYSYQIVRVAEYSVSYTNATNEGEPIMPGNKVTVNFDGLYRGMHKMAGIFNPQATQVTFYNGEDKFKSTSPNQYTAADRCILTVTIPADFDVPEGQDTAACTFTGGYIYGTAYANSKAFGAVYTMTDTGVGVNFNAVTVYFALGYIDDFSIDVAKPVFYQTSFHVHSGEEVIRNYNIVITNDAGDVLVPNADGTYTLTYNPYNYEITGVGFARKLGTFRLGSATPNDNGKVTIDIEVVKTGASPWDGEAVSEPATDENGIYQISTAAEMAWFAQTVNSGTNTISAVLTADIDLAGYEWEPVGSKNKPFQGTFDGQGHKLSNLSIHRSTGQTITYLGLFGYAKNTEIGNFTLTGSVVASGSVYSAYIGGAAGYVNGGKVHDITSYVDVTINRTGSSWQYVAGIIGYIQGAEAAVTNCVNYGTVSGYNYVSGVLAYASAWQVIHITDCINYGDISGYNYVSGIATGAAQDMARNANHGNITGYWYAAGITGWAANKSIFMNECVNTGKISAAKYGGGLAAWFSSGRIESCYNVGEVSADEYVGGLCGMAYNAIIRCNYNVGSVSGTTLVGGLIGESQAGTISKCFSIGTVTGETEMGGAVGRFTSKAAPSELYYLDSACEIGVSSMDDLETQEGAITAVGAETMICAEFVDKLNVDLETPAFAVACSAKYSCPILVWQGGFEHEWVDATCSRAKHCANCDVEDGDPLLHTYGEKTTVAATCTADGYDEFVCTVCGHNYRDNFVAAQGHSYTSVVTEPSCNGVGYTTHTCSVCGDSYVDEIKQPTGHTMVFEVTAPTHDKMGYTTYTCSDCGYSLVGNWTNALGHAYEKTVTREATCTEDGEVTFTCDCGESYTQSIPKTGHHCTSETVAATCTGFGYTLYQCENCDFSYIGKILPATGHTESVVNAKDATWHTEGYTGDTVCDLCGETLTKGKAIPALGCPSKAFADVELDAWYHEAVDYVIANKLMNGTDSKTFAPNGTTTRSMMATLLYRMAGEPRVEGMKNPFTDVPTEAWYNKAVIWAFNEGVVTGASATTFNPDGELTREQLAVMLWRYADKPEADETVLKTFTDVASVGKYAKTAMAWAVENGLVNGVGGNALDPTGTATRAQIATILMRYTQN